MVDIYKYELEFNPLGCALEELNTNTYEKLSAVCKKALEKADVNVEIFLEFNDYARTRFKKFNEKLDYEVVVSDKFKFDSKTLHGNFEKAIENKKDIELYKFLYLFAMKIAELSKNMDLAIEKDLEKDTFSLKNKIWKNVARKIRFSVFFIRNIFEYEDTLKNIPGMNSSLKYFSVKYMQIPMSLPDLLDDDQWKNSFLKGHKNSMEFLEIENLKKDNCFTKICKDSVLEEQECYLDGKKVSREQKELFFQVFPPHVGEVGQDVDVDHVEPQSLLVDVLKDTAEAADLSERYRDNLIDQSNGFLKLKDKKLSVQKNWLQHLFANKNEMVVMISSYNKKKKSDWPFVVFFNKTAKQSIFSLLKDGQTLERDQFFLMFKSRGEDEGVIYVLYKKYVESESLKDGIGSKLSNEIELVRGLANYRRKVVKEREENDIEVQSE